MKKHILTILCFIFCFSVIFAGCKQDTEKPENKDEKPILMFQIDEGLRDSELLGQYRDDLSGLEGALDRIIAACRPLYEKYDVIYHVYVHYHYREKGFSQPKEEPLNRISPELKHMLQYMSEKGEKVILEGFSSGVNTHQTGQADSLPKVPVRYGDSDKINGLGMDVDCYAAIADTYSAFSGVRFHECVGSDTAGGEIRPGNTYPSGYRLSEYGVESIVDMCEEKNKLLVWGDHSWDKIYSSVRYDMWAYLLKYAREKLGKNLIINYSNNSWDIIKSLNMQEFLTEEDCEGASKGYSVQSWFWQENDVASINLPNKEKWYKAAYMDMPVELMAAFTLEGINKGARVIQFEPAQYFFNHKACHVSGMIGYTGFYENEPDYSPRPTLLRFIDLVTDKSDNIPSMVPNTYYATSESKLDLNMEDEKPKKYMQSTLGILGDGSRFYDTYSFDSGETMFEQNENRYSEAMLSGNIIDAAKINLTFGGRDETLIIKEENGNTVGKFYYYNSCELPITQNIFANNESGKVVAVTAANLIRNYVSALDNDPDEIIVARENNGLVFFDLYEAYNAETSSERPFWNFDYKIVANGRSILTEWGVDSMPKNEFAGLYTLRTRRALYSDETRTIDSVSVATITDSGLSTVVKIKNLDRDESVVYDVATMLDIKGDIVDITTNDFDLDCKEEFVLLINQDGKYRIEVYKVNNEQFVKSEQYSFSLTGENYKQIFGNFVGTYYNASLFLP